MHDLLSRLFEPVALIGYGLLLAIAIGTRVSRGCARALSIASILLYFALATPLGANVLLQPLEIRSLISDPGCDAHLIDMVAVLTGGVTRMDGFPQDLTTLQEPSYRRTIAALQLARAHPESFVLVSGGSPSGINEAALTAALLASLGLPSTRIAIDDSSATTVMSARAIHAVARSRGLQRIWLVTSAAHMPRAAWAVRSTGTEVCAVPTDRQFRRPQLPGALLPQISGIEKSTLAIHEYFGIAASYVSQWKRG